MCATLRTDEGLSPALFRDSARFGPLSLAIPFRSVCKTSDFGSGGEPNPESSPGEGVRVLGGAEEAAMANGETRKQQIARRLRVSEKLLEQYLQLKRAEVQDEASLDAPITAERALAPLPGKSSELREKRV